MSKISYSGTGLPFRPISLVDFNRYAKDLGWLIKESHQKSQNLLAKFYGYSGYHELKNALNKETNTDPGPFDSDIRSDFLRVKQGLPSIGVGIKAMAERGNRLLKILRDYRGNDFNDLTKCDWAVREIGLFEQPAEHRRLFNKEKEKFHVLSGAESHGNDLTVFDYADVDYREEDGECFLAFTKLGRSIFDAVNSVLPDSYNSTNEMLKSAESEINKIIDRHPNNPWPFAIYLSNWAPFLWLSPWTDFWDSNETPFDAKDGYKDSAKYFSTILFPDVKRTIALFDEMYCGYADMAPNPKLLTTAYEHGSDSFYWPALLFWGGRIAMNAGQTKEAYKWLSRCHKLDSGDSFGARYDLAILRLNSGKGSVNTLFPKIRDDYYSEPYISMVSCVARAADAHIKGKIDLAKKHFTDALCESWAAAEPFAGRVPELAALKVMSNDRVPATIQEFMYKTNFFWEAHPDTFEFFKLLSSDIGVQSAIKACYLREGELPTPRNNENPDCYEIRSHFYNPGGEFAKLKDCIRTSISNVKIT